MAGRDSTVDPVAEETASRDRGDATLGSVARHVGVSLNTVSRALRAPQTVRPELRARIAKALADLNYVPNRLAGGLAGARSDIVGVVVTSLFHSEFAAVVETLQAALLGRGLQVMLGNTRYDPDEELRIVRSILSWRPAAIAIVGVDLDPRVADLLRASGVPVVQMWDVGGAVIDSVVGMDHEAIGWSQAEHLAEGGHERLAFLGSLRLNDARARKRLRGMEAYLRETAWCPLAVATREETGSVGLGEALVGDLLDRHPDIDGIVCNSDAVAFGVLGGLRRRGRAVPDDCGVIGFGNSEAGACLAPPLTTISPSREAIGRLTAETILARLDGEPPKRVVVDWHLVARASTRPPV